MMFKRLSAIVTSCALLVSAVHFTAPKETHAADNVVISPYNKYAINDGIFEGWGTSLCWWANRVGYSDLLAEQTAELFYGDSGLRMNIARFNIGGGDDPSHDHITRTDSNMPGYTVYNNGNITYNWNADANQRNVLFKSIAACKEDLIVEMFSNSPPYYMTNSGCTSGNTDANKNNLKDDCYDDFAEYLATVCEHYEKEWGVKIQSVSPINEPYTNFWYAGSPKQEGCHFDRGNSESTIMIELSKALGRHGLSDSIVCGMDETSIDTTIDSFNALSSEAKNVLGRIDTHTYSGSKRGELKDLAVKNNRNLWMSEVDGGATLGTNAGQMGAALWLAERMSADLNGMNASAWVLWQAIDKHICAAGYNGKKDSGMPDINGGFWGLAVADHDNNNIILTKKYYAFGQYSRYIRPGFTMLNCSGTNVVGYDKENEQLVIVATNVSESSKDVNYNLSQFDSFGTKVQVIRTSGDVQSGENWKELTPITASNSGVSATLKGHSVTTFIIDNVKSSELDLTEIPVNESMATGSDSWKNDPDTSCKKAVDGDLTTYFDGLGNGYVQIDLGSEYDLSAIGIAPRSGYSYRCIDSYVTVSSDGVDWTEACRINSEPSNGINYFTHLSASENVRYVRYQVPDGAPQNPYNKDSVYCCNVGEIKLYGKPSGIADKIAVTKDMVSGSAAWHDSENDCTKVVDGNLNTYFDGVGDGWVQIDLGKRYDVSAVGFCPRDGFEFRSVDAIISVSENGKDWTVVHTIDSLPPFGMNTLKLDKTMNVRYVKYEVPKGAPQNPYNNDSVYCCNLAELAVYGTESAVVIGDVNADGKFNSADLVMMHKWLLGVGDLTNPNAADLCKDGEVNVFDECIMRQLLVG